MITLSDNEAADSIYARVGDAGLNEVAAAAKMSHFAGDVGHWSNVKVTAADMALFMSKLDELLDLPVRGPRLRDACVGHPVAEVGHP